MLVESALDGVGWPGLYPQLCILASEEGPEFLGVAGQAERGRGMRVFPGALEHDHGLVCCAQFLGRADLVQIGPIHSWRSPDLGVENLNRARRAGTLDRQHHSARLRRQNPLIGAVAPVGPIQSSHLSPMAIGPMAHMRR